MEAFISNKLKSQLSKVFWITLAWTVISILLFLNGYTTLLELSCDMSNHDPMVFFKGSIFTGVIAGLLGGSGVVFLWEEWLRTKSYGWTLLNIFLSYTVIYVVVSWFSGLFLHSRHLDLPIFNAEVWQVVWSHFFEVSQWHNYLIWLFIVLGTLIFLQVNDKYGPGTFMAFIRGKYFHPQREERIFMFLDLRSSTAIAEKLAEVRYFNFLKDVFRHATPAILSSKGEIYQYVGDEMVISWPVDIGTAHANCVACFFQIQKSLVEKTAYYQNHYGVEPQFKAGLHYGHVMAGEIGVVKRDIAFSGDVLNTTSRIQEKCNELGVDILLSQLLVEKIHLATQAFSPRKVGDMILRGKKQKVMLFTV